MDMHPTSPTRMVKVLALAAALLAACQKPKMTQDMDLGDKHVPAWILEEGRIAYTHYCRQCHGDKGDGKGPSAKWYRPPPRDFTKGTSKNLFVMKFATVDITAYLPPDSDFVHILRLGLHGTAMLPWEITDTELIAIIQYIKTFSRNPKGELTWNMNDKVGEPLKFPADPWTGDEENAIALGKRLYNSELIGCNGCHPFYASEREIYEWTKGQKQARRTSSGLTNSDYGPKENKIKLLPPDFVFHELRAVHDDLDVERILGKPDPGHAVRDIYRTIAVGVGGTAMPGQHRNFIDTFGGKKKLPPEVEKYFAGDATPEARGERAVYAVAHYINFLHRLRNPADEPDHSRRMELEAARKDLFAQMAEKFTPPPQPVEPVQPKPAEETKPAEGEGTKPAEGETKPAEGEAPKPAEGEAPKPAGDETKPAEDATKPAGDATKPAGEPSAPEHK